MMHKLQSGDTVMDKETKRRGFVFIKASIGFYVLVKNRLWYSDSALLKSCRCILLEKRKFMLDEFVTSFEPFKSYSFNS